MLKNALVSHDSEIGNLVIFGHVRASVFGDMNVLYRISKAPEEVGCHKFVLACIEDVLTFVCITDLFTNVSNPGVTMDRNMFLGHFFRRSTALNTSIGFQFRGLSVSSPPGVSLLKLTGDWLGKTRDPHIVNTNTQFVVDNSTTTTTTSRLPNLSLLSPVVAAAAAAATVVNVVVVPPPESLSSSAEMDVEESPLAAAMDSVLFAHHDRRPSPPLLLQVPDVSFVGFTASTTTKRTRTRKRQSSTSSREPTMRSKLDRLFTYFD